LFQCYPFTDPVAFHAGTDGDDSAARFVTQD
jgi:hypothetical protein